jgi:hypothetical protein
VRKQDVRNYIVAGRLHPLLHASAEARSLVRGKVDAAALPPQILEQLLQHARHRRLLTGAGDDGVVGLRAIPALTSE